ncbi:oxygenase MpaB family protein, partial [Thermobifida fusca]
GKHMGIKEIPETYDEFYELFDSYEIAHFGYSEGGRAVSDATLRLMVDTVPRWQQPVFRKFTMALLDDRLIQAFRYDPPSRFWRTAAHLAMRLRAKIVRFMPPRVEPYRIENNPKIKSYPNGYDPRRIGTFPKGCPVPHDMVTIEIPETGARIPAPGQELAPQGQDARA